MSVCFCFFYVTIIAGNSGAHGLKTIFTEYKPSESFCTQRSTWTCSRLCTLRVVMICGDRNQAKFSAPRRPPEPASRLPRSPSTARCSAGYIRTGGVARVSSGAIPAYVHIAIATVRQCHAQPTLDGDATEHRGDATGRKHRGDSGCLCFWSRGRHSHMHTAAPDE